MTHAPERQISRTIRIHTCTCDILFMSPLPSSIETRADSGFPHSCTTSSLPSSTDILDTHGRRLLSELLLPTSVYFTLHSRQSVVRLSSYCHWWCLFFYCQWWCLFYYYQWWCLLSYCQWWCLFSYCQWCLFSYSGGVCSYTVSGGVCSTTVTGGVCSSTVSGGVCSSTVSGGVCSSTVSGGVCSTTAVSYTHLTLPTMAVV